MTEDSPLAEWLKQKDMTQAQLAGLARVSHSDVCRVSRGAVFMKGRLRKLMDKYAHEVALAQDEYTRKQQDSLRNRLVAA